MSRADSILAASLASDAAELLLSVRGQVSGAAADGLSNDLILSRLAADRPDDAVLSEESVDDPARLSASRVWIIDPLDGTREYTMPPRVDWAIHIALWEIGRGVTAAAVAEPALDSLISTGSLPVIPRNSRSHPLILVSDSRPPSFAPAVASSVGADLAPMGSAGAKAMAVLRGDADAYLHAGGQWEWDSAAPVGIVLAAGLHASRIDGSDLVYNQAHPYLPDLLICREELAPAILRAVASAL